MTQRSKRVLLVVVTLCLGWGGASSASAQAPQPTERCGSLLQNTSWIKAESPYLVTCNVTLFGGSTLTIEPGVVIQFNPGTSLIIRGTLNAVGKAEDRITFTSATPPNQWGGVPVANTLGGKAVIAFADFSYASLYAALSVECCGGVPEPATISDSTFRNNVSAVGGYAGNNVVIRNSVFENNYAAIERADKLIYDSVFRNNTYGLRGTERISVYNSLFEGNSVALNGGRGTVQDCTIRNNGTGVQGFFEGFILSRNTITGNNISVILTQFSPLVQQNNIFGNTTFNAKVEGSANKSATNNWWGTTNTAEIEAKIHDGKDDATLGLLVYVPFLSGPASLPTTISLVSGNNQTGMVGQALANPFVVKVADANNNPVAGVVVTFAVTAGGGTLPGGVAQLAVNTDVQGQASATLTLGPNLGSNTVTATSGTLTGSPITFTATGVGPPTALSLVSGNNQAGIVGQALGNPFVVKVTDANNIPMPGVAVSFAVTGGGGTLSGGLAQRTINTDAQGLASSTLTLGPIVGTNTVTATSAGLTGSPITFTAASVAGPPALLSRLSGNNQTGTVGQALASPFVVKVGDAFGNPVTGVSVTFAVTAGGGTVSVTSAVTNTQGQVSSTLTLGLTAGTNTATATSAGLTGSPITFTATGVAGPPTTFSLVSGNKQTGAAGRALASPFVVKVTDANNNPVAGVAVTFAVTAGGGTLPGGLTQLAVNTNAQGQASTTLTLGQSPGTNTVTSRAC